MICENCGTALSQYALHCWNCGADTPNYTDEVKALQAQDERSSVLAAQRNVPFSQVRPGKQRLLRVYKQTRLGQMLAGWLDENGNTYAVGWSRRPVRKPLWSVDEGGRISMVAGDGTASVVIGWVGEGGAVYDRYGRPVSGFFDPRSRSLTFQPAQSFAPELAFQVAPDGTLYSHNKRGIKRIGKVVGTTDLYKMAALALMVLH